MPYSSVEFEVSQDSHGRPKVRSGDVLSALKNALQQNEIAVACRLYEETGRAVAERLLAAARDDVQLRDPAAEMFARARDFGRAAKLHDHARNWPDAAQYYSEAADFEDAARCYKKAGDLFHAAQCLDALGEVDEAVALYDKQGEAEVAADCLARNGRHYDAAQRFHALGRAAAEADSLRQVPAGDRKRPQALKRLAEILLGRNRLAEATELIVNALREEDKVKDDADLHELCAVLFDKQGFPEHAQRMRHRLLRLQKRKLATRVADDERERQGLPPTPSQEKRRLDAAAELVQGPDDGYEKLKSVPLFAKLPIGDLRDLHRLTTEVAYQPGATLIEADRESPGLILLLEGSAEVYAVGKGGNTRHLNSASAGDYLGEIALLSGGLASARVVASSYVRALSISAERFEHFLSARPATALRVYKAFAKGLSDRVRALSTA